MNKENNRLISLFELKIVPLCECITRFPIDEKFDNGEFSVEYENIQGITKSILSAPILQ